jgi:hypothetical protein
VAKKITEDVQAAVCDIQQATIESFVKNAFCVDGEVKTVFTPRLFKSHIECNDKVRGKFVVAFEKD